MDFISLESDAKEYFKMLPLDWQAIIVPVWNTYKTNANIYVLTDQGAIVAGGIVFEQDPPNMTDFELTEGKKYRDVSFQYIGFLYVDPNRRNQALGTQWLNALKARQPKQSYWLTIEEEGLQAFYEKNGFQVVSQSKDPSNREWLFIYTP
ncbi:Acetyltransferase (GNAT) domain-containing protein [Arenibacter nanhaiticus]|uniref:Acetyltransferase (GNAT) domain-containing protein n=1 Tax=Arenibacter nanhaiticus TaxID=558155 RepID=A0A1M6KJ55_9FLAO|nr:GNAT family N-acetyltransferase [Arenibacter nanhaiticus]SHJ58983.1 Acetyltransferase (GNAT) domain-containing protein [Arenibacter nanhaiticus]